MGNKIAESLEKQRKALAIFLEENGADNELTRRLVNNELSMPYSWPGNVLLATIVGQNKEIISLLEEIKKLMEEKN